MGFEVKRFVDNVSNELICGICNGVLQDPYMIKECHHFFCVNCLRNQMKISAVCPKDRNMFSFSKLIEPQKLILNLLNELRIKCEFTSGGCEEVLILAQLDKHRRVCEKNPMNTVPIKCFCGQNAPKKELGQHKHNCLQSTKNEIHINRSQIATFMADIFSQCTQKTVRRFRSETEYLYHKLSQSLPQRSRNQNSIENILLYLNWRLLDQNKSSAEEYNRIKLGIKDLNRATHQNSEAIRHFHRLNGLDYILLIRNMNKNRDIDLSITDFLLNFCQFKAHLKKLMDRSILDMLLNLIHPKINGIENSFNCVDILSQMITTFKDEWNELSSSKERNDILNRIKITINGWKLNVRLRMYSSLDNQMAKLKQHLNEIPAEVVYRYVWVLVHHTRANPNKYVPMIDEKNVIELLQPLLDDNKTEAYIKDFIQLLFHQIISFRTLGHLNGLENSDKREFLIN